MSDDHNYPAANHYAGKFAADYDNARMAKPKWLAEQQAIEDFLGRTKPGETILDVPFGTGRFLELCQNAQLKVTGADISQDMLDAATIKLGEKTKGVKLVAASAEDMPFEDNAFDYLICNRFIKWLPSMAHLKPVAQEFRRVTSGQILLQVKLKASTPFQRLQDNFIKARRNLLRLLGINARAGTTRYSLAEIKAAFEGEGWKISEVMKCPGAGRDVVCIILSSHQG